MYEYNSVSIQVKPCRFWRYERLPNGFCAQSIGGFSRTLKWKTSNFHRRASCRTLLEYFLSVMARSVGQPERLSSPAARPSRPPLGFLPFPPLPFLPPFGFAAAAALSATSPAEADAVKSAPARAQHNTTATAAPLPPRTTLLLPIRIPSGLV